MILVSSVFKKGFDNNYDLTIYVLFLLFIFAMGYLAVQDVKAGYIYVIFSLVALAGVYLLTFFTTNKNADIGSLMKDFFVVPFNTSMRKAVKWLLVGLGVPYLLYALLSSVFPSFSLTTLSAPLFSTSSSGNFVTLSAAKVGLSPAWESFVTSFGAGTGETLIFSFLLVLAFIPLVLYFTKLFRGSYDRVKPNVVLFFSILLSSLVFTGVHVLNGTYEGTAFLFAFGFMFFSNVSIYFLGVPLIAWLGFHISWNQVILVRDNGFSWFFNNVLLSWYGVLLVFFVFSLSWFLFRRGKD